MITDINGTKISPEDIITAYQMRMFPMGDERDSKFAWYRPESRAIITMDSYKIPKSLKREFKKTAFKFTVNKAFKEVIRECANRENTWITHDIEALYIELQKKGFAYSFEAWDNEKLIGGLYGLTIGKCFCGESMFRKESNASKFCVIHLMEHLKANGFKMLDCQQQTEHMERFGAHEVTDEEYAILLEDCL